MQVHDNSVTISSANDNVSSQDLSSHEACENVTNRTYH